MTIAAADTEVAYDGDGVIRAFTLSCEVQLAGDFVATIDGVVTTAYVLTGLGSSGGVVCTFTVAPAALAKIVLARVAPYNRLLYDYGLGGLNPDTLDDDLDRLDMQTQQLATILMKRTPHVAVGSLAISLNLVPEAGKVLYWTSATSLGNVGLSTLTPGVIPVSTFAQTLLDDNSATEARATLGITSEWTTLDLAATYISPTSFSVTTDQTTTLHVGRRLRTFHSGGTSYSTMLSSVFAAGVTTGVVVNGPTALAAGITAVHYGILAATNPSAPTITGLSVGTVVDPDADYFPMLDTSVGSMVKVLPKNATPASSCLVIAYLADALFNIPDVTWAELGSGASTFTEILDSGNNFDAASGRFTVPATGVYQFSFRSQLQTFAGNPTEKFIVILATSSFATSYLFGASTANATVTANEDITSAGGGLVSLTIGAIVSLWVFHDTGTSRFVVGGSQPLTAIEIVRIS